MIELLLRLLNQDFRHLVSTGDKVYLVQQHSDLEMNEITRERLDSILQESFSFEKSNVQRIVFNRKNNRLTVCMRSSDEQDVTLHFASKKAIAHFIQIMPNAHAEVNHQSNAIPVITGIWLLLIVYAFIWAGTRESPEDVNPYGIRLRIAYAGALLMQKLVMAIGQALTLRIGIVLLVGFIWLFYVKYLKGPETIVYQVQPENNPKL